MQNLNRSSVRRAIVAVSLAFICKGFFYATVIPIWEGYDEYEHLAFIQHLAIHHDLPTPDTKVSHEIDRSLELAPLPWELRYLPAPHVIHDLFWKLPSHERLQRRHELLAIPRQWQSESGTTLLYEGKQGPLYYWLMWPLYRIVEEMTLPNRVFVFRIVNILLGSLLISIGFVTTNAIFGDERIGIAVSALIAAMPELYMDAFRIGNQTLTIVLYSLFTLFCLKCVDGKVRYLPAAGTTLGLLLITRAYSIAAVPALLLTALRAAWRARIDERKYVFRLSAEAVAAAVLIAGWWYVRNLRMVGSIIWYDASPTQPLGLADIARHALKVHWRSAFASLFGSHIWFGNWTFLSLRSWMYQVFEYAALLSLVGLIITVIRNLKSASSENAKIFVLVTIYGGFLLAIAYHILMNSINVGVDASAGWYLYSVVAAETILFVADMLAFRRGKAIVATIVVFFFLLEMYATHFLIIPYYTGLIAHAPNGGLQSFHISQLATISMKELLARLEINRASLVTDPTLIILWCLFLAASALLPHTAVAALYDRFPIRARPEGLQKP